MNFICIFIFLNNNLRKIYTTDVAFKKYYIYGSTSNGLRLKVLLAGQQGANSAKRRCKGW